MRFITDKFIAIPFIINKRNMFKTYLCLSYRNMNYSNFTKYQPINYQL